MKLTKERAKKPLLEDAASCASTRYDNGETSFTLTCFGPWIQGKGHESSYTLHLTELEMLDAVSMWMEKLREMRVREIKKRGALPPADRQTPPDNSTPRNP